MAAVSSQPAGIANTKKLSRRSLQILTIIIAALGLAGCQAAGNAEQAKPDNPGLTKAERGSRTEVTIIGMIHGGHRTSSDYPLSRIKAVVRDIAPDIILTEIPPSRVDAAVTSFRESGKVTERRTRAFPEYTDVIIPLQQELGYTLKGTAAWTPQIASKRRAALNAVRNSQARASQWQTWQDAQARFRRTLSGRGDDPLYIHTPAYDRAVEARYRPYVEYFDKDIGAGGWKPINQAHWANISSELDAIRGQGKRVLITYGGFHKYWFLRELEKRDDVILTPALPFFERNPG